MIRINSLNTRVIMMIMNPFSGLRGLIRPFLDSYIAAHRESAAKRDIEVIDHSLGWSKVPVRELAIAIPDGAHPIPSVASEIMVPRLVFEICGSNHR